VRTPALYLTTAGILVLFSRIQRLMLSNAARKVSSSALVVGRFLRTLC
jgi:hypothetical protein